MPIRINPKPKSKPEPDFLCRLADCDACILYRTLNELPMPKLISRKQYQKILKSRVKNP